MLKRKAGDTFFSTSAKDYIRDVIDRDVLRRFVSECYPDERLAYLGLPGEALLDVLAWRRFIERWTAVQVVRSSAEEEIADELERNALREHLEQGFHMLRADIDALLIDSDERLRWPYHIVNLDYYGGLVNAAEDGGSRRLRAIKSLFSLQAGTPFVLFLTLNLRDDDQGELTDLIASAEEDLRYSRLEGVSECFDAHRKLGHAGELKLYVPIFLGNEAKSHNLRFVPPVLYQGTVQMIHFAVQCIPFTATEAGRLFHMREMVEVINQPLLVLREGAALNSVQLGSIRQPGR